MVRRLVIAAALLVTAGALAQTARAGGWATVTLDAPIGEPRVGQALNVSFVVKQHGETPVHQAFDQPVRPFFIATHRGTGETIKPPARPTATLGQFVVEVVFPRAGTWTAEIVPEPFGGTRLDPVTVLTPAGERPIETSAVKAADEAAIGQAAPARAAPASSSGGGTRDTAVALGLVAVAALAAGVVFVRGPRIFRRTRG
jgi:hypothetical protein